MNLKVRDNDEKMQDELERFEREEKRLVKIKLLNTELRGEKERIELKKKDMMKVSKTISRVYTVVLNQLILNVSHFILPDFG